MSLMILTFAIGLSQLMLALALVMASSRALWGPRAQDRVLALDASYICAMLLLLVTGMKYASPYFFEGAFIISVLGFVATVALAKFLFRGEVIE